MTRLEDQLPRGRAVLPAEVHIHFDGACQPPEGGGVATYGYTVEGPGLNEEGSGLAVTPWTPRATNNVAEYTAAIRALEWLRDYSYAGPVRMKGDSQLVIRQMQGRYRVRALHLQEYHAELTRLGKLFERVEWEWVSRDANARADALSKEALQREWGEALRYRPPRPVVPEAEADETTEGMPGSRGPG